MAKRTVVLLGNELVTQDEDDKAAAAITPGMLLTWNGSGDWIPHGTAAGVNVDKVFALEREEAGRDMDEVYAIGDTVKAGRCAPGVRLNALLAVGVNAGKGAVLESAGNGALRLWTAGTPVARTLEALNNTSGALARIRVVVM